MLANIYTIYCICFLLLLWQEIKEHILSLLWKIMNSLDKSTKSHLLPTSSYKHKHGHKSRHISKHNQAFANSWKQVPHDRMQIWCRILQDFHTFHPAQCIWFGLRVDVYTASSKSRLQPGCNRNHVLCAMNHVVQSWLILRLLEDTGGWNTRVRKPQHDKCCTNNNVTPASATVSLLYEGFLFLL